MIVLQVVHWIITQIRFLLLALLPSVLYGSIVYSLGNLFHDLTRYGSSSFVKWYAIASFFVWLWIDKNRIKSIIIKTYTMYNSKLVLALIMTFWTAEKKVLSDDEAKKIAEYGDAIIRHGANEATFVEETCKALGIINSPGRTDKLLSYFKVKDAATVGAAAVPPSLSGHKFEPESAKASNDEEKKEDSKA